MYKTNCKRCSKEIYTLSKPIYSSKETMEKWQGICSGCITPEEEMEMFYGDMRRDVKLINHALAGKGHRHDR